MIEHPKTGQRVTHIGSKSNPRYNPGIGTIVAVHDSRVRVKWDKIAKARNYKADNLEAVRR